MSNLGGYQVLTTTAKKVGGPEELVILFTENGRAVGRIEGQISMLPWIGVAALVASALTVVTIQLNNHSKAKKAVFQAAVNEAKTELIHGTKEYDMNHPDESEDNASEKGEENNE